VGNSFSRFYIVIYVVYGVMVNVCESALNKEHADNDKM